MSSLTANASARIFCTRRIITPDVLRLQVLAGYLTAMFHAGAVSIEECRQMIAGELESLDLTLGGDGGGT